MAKMDPSQKLQGGAENPKYIEISEDIPPKRSRKKNQSKEQIRRRVVNEAVKEYSSDKEDNLTTSRLIFPAIMETIAIAVDVMRIFIAVIFPVEPVLGLGKRFIQRQFNDNRIHDNGRQGSRTFLGKIYRWPIINLLMPFSSNALGNQTFKDVLNNGDFRKQNMKRNRVADIAGHLGYDPLEQLQRQELLGAFDDVKSIEKNQSLTDLIATELKKTKKNPNKTPRKNAAIPNASELDYLSQLQLKYSKDTWQETVDEYGTPWRSFLKELEKKRQKEDEQEDEIVVLL